MLATAHVAADWGVFLVAAVVVLAGALGVVTARHPVHCALFLIQTLFGVAVLFVSELAHFLAAVQVIVYAGAIVVLFLFVIMLLGVDRSEQVLAEPLKGQRPTAILLGIIGLAEFVGLVRSNEWATGAVSVAGPANAAGSNVELLGRSLFSTYLLPFEVTSVLLIIAVVAAVVLARRPPRLTAEEEAAERESAERETRAREGVAS
ncbi:MAG TPA: NADH-quinone oxidoreductase subunit J [Acidimicrobiales bacterium]|jgi:NADH-quinone oxidoreductase subunit J